MSLFETNIRIMGGLLAAHEVSGEGVFLEKAKDLAERVEQAFNGSTGGFCGWLCDCMVCGAGL